MSADVQDLLRRLARADRRAAAWCAAQCARTALPLVPPDESRPGRAIEAAEAWALGRATEEACRSAAHAVEAAAEAADEEAASARTDAATAVSYAVSAALSVASVCVPDATSPGMDPAEGETLAADAAANAARAASRAVAHATGPDAWREVSERHLAALLDLVRAQRWTPTRPEPATIRDAPAAVQVALDAVAAPVGDGSVPELLEAHARAERLGLDWRDPVQRAVAERTDDEERVRALLSPGGGREDPVGITF